MKREFIVIHSPPTLIITYVFALTPLSTLTTYFGIGVYVFHTLAYCGD